MIYVHTGDAVVPAEEARVPVLDHGFLFGDSVYDVVRTSGGVPFLWQPHLDRLRRSAAQLYFELPWSDAEIERRVHELLAVVGEPDAYVRLVATRGPGPITLLPDDCNQPGLYLIGCKVMRPDAHLYEHGCRVSLVERLRNDRRALDPSAKTGNYLNNMLGLIEARRAEADDALFLNVDGHVTEATTSNLWIVESDTVVTPPLPDGLLAGVTRDWLLAQCRELGIAAREDSIDAARLRTADEVFLSGTIKGVMPVGWIDGVAVADGPGPVTKRLHAAYETALAQASR